VELERFDLLRIDHFRGLDSYWEIPAEAPSAVEGRWLDGPGTELFEALEASLGPLPLVAEDLGDLRPSVHALRERLGIPGMRVLQFAFDDDSDNVHLPHNHEPQCIVYPGTHDNDTTLGWWQGLPRATRERVQDYLGHPGEPMPAPLLRAALASVARLAVIPAQDLLGLGSEHRMNTPGTTSGNWRWRLPQGALDTEAAARLRALARRYGRHAPR
jgi:4-alpha-glucanotransferase